MSEKNAQLYVDKDGYLHREGVDEEEYYAKPKKPETVTAFAYENALMHKDMDNERANRTTLFVCIFALLFALTFVIAYTVRMNTFVDLIREMNAAIVELAGAKGIISP